MRKLRRAVPRMKAPGSYRPPAWKGTGAMNMPKPGRVGKILPPLKKLGRKR